MTKPEKNIIKSNNTSTGIVNHRLLRFKIRVILLNISIIKPKVMLYGKEICYSYYFFVRTGRIRFGKRVTHNSHLRPSQPRAVQNSRP